MAFWRINQIGVFNILYAIISNCEERVSLKFWIVNEISANACIQCTSGCYVSSTTQLHIHMTCGYEHENAYELMLIPSYIFISKWGDFNHQNIYTLYLHVRSIRYGWPWNYRWSLQRIATKTIAWKVTEILSLRICVS